MHPELFLLIGISCSLGFTPGPNNAVASFSGFNFGIKKTIPSILGVWLGYTTLVILINFVLISTFLKYPTIQEVIRLLGTFFLLYLAYKISFSTPSKEGKKINPVKFIDTFIFQFLNPKGIMAAITLISNFVLEDDYINSSLTVIVVCSLTA
jgi:threonine/homoserine/homoserine lactone efflux protein